MAGVAYAVYTPAVRFLFVMDPFEGLAWDKDTSFAFMRAAARRGHEVWHCLLHHLGHRGRAVHARARRLTVHAGPPFLTADSERTIELFDFDAVLLRKDPPFDVPYLRATQQLDLVKSRVLVVNDPRGLRDANEKLFTFQFAEHMPRSLVSADRDAMLAFVDEVGGTAVLKPLDGAGGSGVVVLSSGDRNCRSLIDVWTEEGRRPALVQEYQPAVRTGDKRVLVLDGAPLGAILRVPREDDVRANIHAGGRVVPTELTAREAALVADVSPVLCQHGLWFVGLDLIGERLIEVNVTSPTGIQELSAFVGRPVEDDVIAWVEGRATELRGEAGV
ncbi:MAG TPA: glutathione synthase [Polyangiaceae bacterium]|nr:glutathione synthase [Polyangiaceae bacterium]